MLAPLLFNIFFAAVIDVAYTRFEADEISWTPWWAGGNNGQRANPDDVTLGHAIH